MQDFMGKLYTKAKPALRERPYFQILALIKHLGEGTPYSIIQELQSIKYTKQHNINYHQAHLVR
jgi:hypothetical protein